MLKYLLICYMVCVTMQCDLHSKTKKDTTLSTEDPPATVEDVVEGEVRPPPVSRKAVPTEQGDAMDGSQDDVETEYRETHFDLTEDKIISNSSFPMNELILLSGSFTMGTMESPIPNDGDGEGPTRHVTLRPFYIDKYEVSNGEFAEFVSATNYKTEAELFGNSFVMEYFVSKEVNEKITTAVKDAKWWLPVPGANWKHPEGKDSNIANRMNHPVVHMSWNDAAHFCRWKGKRLPTEAEWEFAARGGKENKLFPWGDKFLVNKKYRANIWQGKFPVENTEADGYAGTCEVDKYEPQNDYHLYNMVGNVWEWVDDWYTTEHDWKPVANPPGPSVGTDKVKRGGSYMCSEGFCYRYRCSSRSSNSADSSAHNLGFRCAKSAKKTKNTTKDEL